MDYVLEQPGSRSLISRLSIVELESVLAIKTRTAEIDERALQIARRRFSADIARQRLFVAPPVHERHFQRTRRLLIEYGVAEGLRTLDAYSWPSRSICAKSGTLTSLSQPIRGSAGSLRWPAVRL